jgi:NADPH:quinone reductase-like Zn-dependent oxidoreductase
VRPEHPDPAPISMRALRVHDRHSPKAIYAEMPVPRPGIGDVLLAVGPASFTPTELSWPSTWADRAGRARAPVVPGHEVSGTVTALGYGTTGLAVGDEVYGITDWYRDGSAADYVAVEARNLAARPSSASRAEAASLPLTGLTAWQALFTHGHLQAGQTVVITGASGGVGTIAVQLARDAGARVAAVAHDWARQLVSDLGADDVADADDPAASHVSNADILVVFFIVEPDRAQLARLAGLVDAGRIRPVAGAVVDMAAGWAEGFAAKHHGGIAGKVVLQPHRQTGQPTRPEP